MEFIKIRKRKKLNELDKTVFSLFRNEHIARANFYLLAYLIFAVIMVWDYELLMIFMIVACILGMLGNIFKKSMLSIMSIIILCIGGLIYLYILIQNYSRGTLSQFCMYLASLFLIYKAATQIKKIEKNKEAVDKLNWFFEKNKK